MSSNVRIHHIDTARAAKSLPPKVKGPSRHQLKINVPKIRWNKNYQTAAKLTGVLDAVDALVRLKWWGDARELDGVNSLTTDFHPISVREGVLGNTSAQVNQLETSKTAASFDIKCSKAGFQRYLADMKSLTFVVHVKDRVVGSASLLQFNDLIRDGRMECFLSIHAHKSAPPSPSLSIGTLQLTLTLHTLSHLLPSNDMEMAAGATQEHSKVCKASANPLHATVDSNSANSIRSPCTPSPLHLSSLLQKAKKLHAEMTKALENLSDEARMMEEVVVLDEAPKVSSSITSHKTARSTCENDVYQEILKDLATVSDDLAESFSTDGSLLFGHRPLSTTSPLH